MSTNVDRWTPWYDDAKRQIPYGDTVSYFMAEDWLRGIEVQDWGCGYGWFKNVHYGNYVGIDGTKSKWCDIVADLTEFVSSSPGILLRHVLEHNHDWKKILDNAVASFTRRLCIVLFTPLAEETKVIVEDVCGLGVPDISFNLDDILSRLDCRFFVDTMPSGSIYGVETIIRAQRSFYKK